MNADTRHDRRSRLGLIVLAFVVFGTSVVIAACSSQPSCSGGLHPYKDKCLTNMAIQYVGCTEGRGISTTNEISAGVGGTLKVIADATLNVALKQSQTENTPVALQIVKDCMEIAKTNSPPDDPEQAIAAGYEKQWQDLVVSETPSISISRSSAGIGDTVRVTGSQFWANETVEVRLHASVLTQVKADANGAFTVDITVPQDAPPAGFSTTITATGRSSAKSADAPFQRAP